MQKTYLNTTEHDDMSITPYLVLESLPGLLKDLLRVAKTDDERDMLLAALPEEFTHEDYTKHAQQNGIPLRTSDRWLSQWTEAQVIQHLRYGTYRKVS